MRPPAGEKGEARTYASPSSSESSPRDRLFAFFAGVFCVATPLAGASFFFAGGGGEGERDSARLKFIDASSSDDTSPPARARSSSSTSDMATKSGRPRATARSFYPKNSGTFTMQSEAWELGSDSREDGGAGDGTTMRESTALDDDVGGCPSGRRSEKLQQDVKREDKVCYLTQTALRGRVVLTTVSTPRPLEL